VAPGLFSADATGKGTAAAVVLCVSADGSTTSAPAAQCDPKTGLCAGRPIDVSDPSKKVWLSLYGTGIRGHSSANQVGVTIDGLSGKVAYAGAQPQYAGLDQINVLLPSALAGKGNLEVKTTVDGIAANVLTINVR
jgi:uncharacterized protein (TIGR03437 family)